MRLTTNFDLSEFNKHNFPISDTVFQNIFALAKNLQVLRDEVKKPIKITSGYRSPEHNAKVGGVKSSRHITGEAADFKIAGMTPKEVADVIEKLIAANKMEEGGIGIYSTWIHYDHRNVKARWTK
jgi:uncharacterized protein YcbK (DUF882 family)